MDNTMLGRLIRLIVTVPDEMFGALCDLVEKLASNRGGEWFERLKLFLRGELTELNQAVEEVKTYLRRLYEREVINIGDATFAVYEQIANGNFAQLFGSLSDDMNKLAFSSRVEVDDFCRIHPNRLINQEGSATFFLYKGENGDFFVAYVIVGGGGRLRVIDFPLGHDFPWFANMRHRIVVPEQ